MGKKPEHSQSGSAKDVNGSTLLPKDVTSIDDIPAGELEDFVPKPPDGGWGWVVMCASFLNNFILDGIAYTFGVFLHDYIEYFQSTTAATSLASALLCGVYLLVGPIVGALVNKYGCRAVGITGSVLGAGAFIVSMFSPNLEFMIITYGFIGGCAFGMMYLPAVVSVGYYFEKKRSVATGIAVCGTGIGTFCLAPFAKLLLEKYDWKNAHLILAGLILQGCVSSALMRPLEARMPPSSTRGDKPKQSSADMKKVSQAEPSPKLPVKSAVPQRMFGSAYIRSTGNVVSCQDLARPMFKKDIFLSGSIHNLALSRHLSLAGSSYTASMTRLPRNKTEKKSCFDWLPTPMADILREMVDPSVLLNRGMLVLSVANVIGMVGFYVPIIFTAPRAEELGVSPTDAALLLSIMGIFNTIGRVLSGTISMVPSVSPLLVNNISITLAGLAVIFTPFCTTYITMAVAIGAAGLFLSTYVSLASVIICEMVGLEKLTNGFGLLCMVRGVTAIAGPPFEGWLYDATGSYDMTFYVGGACLIVSGLMHFLLHMSVFQQKVNQNEIEKQSE